MPPTIYKRGKANTETHACISLPLSGAPADQSLTISRASGANFPAAEVTRPTTYKQLLKISFEQMAVASNSFNSTGALCV